jgi:hypothetical protein
MIKVLKELRENDELNKKQPSKSFSTQKLNKRSIIGLTKNPVFKNKIYTPIKYIEYEDSIVLSIKNHVGDYPTPINLTHA